MKIYQDIQEKSKAFTKWSLNTDCSKEEFGRRHNEACSEIASLQGSGTFTLTKDQAKMLAIIDKKIGELRPRLQVTIFVENGNGFLYATDATVLVKIPVKVETTYTAYASFWGVVRTFVEGVNQISPQPEDQVIFPADFESVIPEKKKHELFTCKEQDLLDYCKAVGHMFYHTKIKVTEDDLKLTAFGLKEKYDDLQLNLTGEIRAVTQKDGYVFGFSPETLQILLSADKERRVTFIQEKPTSAIIIQKEMDETLYLLAPIML